MIPVCLKMLTQEPNICWFKNLFLLFKCIFWGCVSPIFSFQQWANESTILVGQSIHMKYILLGRSTTMIMGIASSLCWSYLREWEEQHQKMRMSVMFGSGKNGTNLWNAAIWGHRESSLHAFQWSQVKHVERGWTTSNPSSFATLACWVINHRTYKLQRKCSFLQMIFCQEHCALTISYTFPWMRRKNSTRPLLLPGWYAISAKRPDISWWQSPRGHPSYM